MITLRPSASTQQQFTHNIEQIRMIGTPPAPMVSAVQEAICAEFANNFESESDAGLTWPRLSEVTIRIRLAEGFGAGPILVRTGDYKRSWVDSNHPMHVHELRQSPKQVSVEEGSQHPFAAKHELGEGKTPARRASRVSAGGIERISKVIEAWLKRTVPK